MDIGTWYSEHCNIVFTNCYTTGNAKSASDLYLNHEMFQNCLQLLDLAKGLLGGRGLLNV